MQFLRNTFLSRDYDPALYSYWRRRRFCQNNLLPLLITLRTQDMARFIFNRQANPKDL